MTFDSTEACRRRTIAINAMNNIRLLIAVDPGVHGALAVNFPKELKSKAQGIYVYNWNGEADAIELVKELKSYADSELVQAEAYIEQVGGYVKGKPAPGSAMFNFGKNFGFWLAAFSYAGIPLRFVRPQMWQKGLPVKAAAQGANRKRALREIAAKLYPQIRVTLNNADALLLLDYAARSREHYN